MFYLLNSLYSKVWNKRIVCDKELLDSYKERGNDYFGEPEIEIYQNPTKKLELHIVGKKKDGGKYIYANEGIVELQSENVYKLIEKGDLVRYLNNIYEIKHVYYNDDGVFDFVTSICGICFPSWKNFLKGLNAIYKPNLKGDYIKVWEKED